MPKSPQDASDGVLCVTVKSDGQALSDDALLLAVHIHHTVARIPSARLVVQDGDVPTGRWPVADGGVFKLGGAITISAGYGDIGDAKEVFKGVVVKLGTRIRANGNTHLEVECRGQAVKMSVGRRNAHYAGVTDSEIITRLIGDHGLQAAVDATLHTHRGLTQYGCTDWDFIVTRAQANGLVVIAGNDQLLVQTPRVGNEPLLELQCGADLLEFEGDAEALGPELPVQAGAVGVRGRMRFQGSATAQVGSMIRVKGVGDGYG